MRIIGFMGCSENVGILGEYQVDINGTKMRGNSPMRFGFLSELKEENIATVTQNHKTIYQVLFLRPKENE